MKKYIIEVNWSNGFSHTYDVIGGLEGNRDDPVVSAKAHLNSINNVIGYIIRNEDGSIIYEQSRDNPKT